MGYTAKIHQSGGNTVESQFCSNQYLDFFFFYNFKQSYKVQKKKKKAHAKKRNHKHNKTMLKNIVHLNGCRDDHA